MNVTPPPCPLLFIRVAVELLGLGDIWRVEIFGDFRMDPPQCQQERGVDKRALIVLPLLPVVAFHRVIGY